LLVLSSLSGTLAHPGPGLDPATVEAVVFPGESIDVTKTVHTPTIPPQPDIMFLADTTGSMGGAIANVKANASAIMASVAGVQPDAQFGAAQYRDVGFDPLFRVDQAITANQVAVQSAINTWSAGGGGDLPEAQLNALWQLGATPVGGFRPAPSTRIIVWFGDAPGHDLSNSPSLASAIAALQAADITVIAINVTGATGLNATGQAAAITGATGGSFFPSAASNEVAAAILSSLNNLPADVSMVSNCAAPISKTFAPATQNVTSGTDAVFTETIGVAVGTAGGTYTCQDWALINGNPMNDVNGNLIVESETIHVPGISLAPATATNELGTPGQTHTVTATVAAGSNGPVSGVRVEFEILSGPNVGATGDGTTDGSGEAVFTYPAVQGPAGLGQDLIVARFTNADGSVVYGSDSATKDWVDTTAPVCACEQGPNPRGKIPSAPDNGGQAQNPDGF